MTAVTATSQSTRKRPATLRFVVSFLAFAFAVSTAIIAGSAHFAAQDSPATPGAEATPTQQDLQERRDQAIADGVAQLEVEFEEYNDSGVEGTATFYDLGDETLIAISIEGGGEAHPAHIHEGTCGNAEPQPFVPLTTVDETGESLSLIDTSLSELIDGGDYTIDLHLSPNELGTLIVCANIEGTTTPATPDPDATPAPTSTPVPDTATETPPVTATGEGGISETPTATQAPATETPTDAPTEVLVPAETPTEAPADTPVPTVAPTEAPDTTPVATEDVSTPEVPADEDGTGGPQAAPGSVASLPLADYSGLGVHGTVSLIAIDEKTSRVTIRLKGDNVTGGHIAHLHPGTCEDPQDEGTIYLESVDSNGVSETTVGLSITELLNNDWIVNVHLSEADWDTWLVCGYLGDATGGMTGVQDITPVPTTPTPSTIVSKADGTSGVGTSGKGEPVSSAGGTANGDGTTGVSGKGERSTTTLAQNVGVGSAIPWPESPAEAITWSLGVFAIVLAAAGIMLRRGERNYRQPTRWHRLGL